MYPALLCDIESDRRLFRSKVHSIETKGQFNRSIGFDRKVMIKTETQCIYRLFFVLLSSAKLNIFKQIWFVLIEMTFKKNLQLNWLAFLLCDSVQKMTIFSTSCKWPLFTNCAKFDTVQYLEHLTDSHTVAYIRADDLTWTENDYMLLTENLHVNPSVVWLVVGKRFVSVLLNSWGCYERTHPYFVSA